MTDVLVLNYSRREAHVGTVDPDSNWASVTTSLYSSDFNQSQNKFLEIWLKTASDVDGKVTVDLGFISEDQNGNGMFDTEDKPEAGLLTGNTLLEKEEDVGLDGCEDAYENGLGGCLDTLYADVVDNPEWRNNLYGGATVIPMIRTVTTGPLMNNRLSWQIGREIQNRTVSSTALSRTAIPPQVRFRWKAADIPILKISTVMETLTVKMTISVPLSI